MKKTVVGAVLQMTTRRLPYGGRRAGFWGPAGRLLGAGGQAFGSQWAGFWEPAGRLLGADGLPYTCRHE